MKTIKLEVTLEFTGDISDDNLIKETMGNVLDALVYHVNEVGIAPEASDVYTQKITINEGFTGTELTHTF